MIVLDATIVNVALPSIREDLGFSQTSLAWVVNAYLLTFGGFLLLGRTPRRPLRAPARSSSSGSRSSRLASLACGLSTTQGMLVAARAIQGFGGAVVSAVALSLIMTLFTGAGDRAKAMGVFGFVAAGGGTVGVLLGGILTDLLTWHWIFLVNIPVGIAVFALCVVLLPGTAARRGEGRLDVAGARHGHGRAHARRLRDREREQQRLDLRRDARAPRRRRSSSSAIFLAIEARVAAPLVPLGLFKHRNLSVANVTACSRPPRCSRCSSSPRSTCSCVLGYSPLEVGLAYVPNSLIMAGLSLGVSAKLVMRFGIRVPLVVGMLLSAASLLLFARAPVDGSYVVDLLPPLVLLGLGAGIAFNPMLLAAMGDVEQSEAGLASGVVNTSFMMGGALGLAILASLATSRTDNLLASGEDQLAALNGGYHVAFLVGAIFAVGAAVIGGTLLRPQPQGAHREAPEAIGPPATADAD